MILFYDTETTGFTTNQPLDHPSQPHLVQLACLLTSDEGMEIACLNTMVHCPVPVPPQASAIHGIDGRASMTLGMPMKHALPIFFGFCRKADTIVAHNNDFDKKIMEIAFARHFPDRNPFEDRVQFCTMKATTDMCKIPKTRGSGYKWPKLEEVYHCFFNESFDNAHDAMADLRATLRVYKEWRRRTFEALNQS